MPTPTRGRATPWRRRTPSPARRTRSGPSATRRSTSTRAAPRITRRDDGAGPRAGPAPPQRARRGTRRRRGRGGLRRRDRARPGARGEPAAGRHTDDRPDAEPVAAPARGARDGDGNDVGAVTFSELWVDFVRDELPAARRQPSRIRR